MSFCDPTRNIPRPRSGNKRVGERQCCGASLNLECLPTCYTRRPVPSTGAPEFVDRSTQRNPPPETGKIPHFNALEIQRLQVKVDGHTETLFIAILNGNAAGQVIGVIQPWKACSARMLFVTPKHRHVGIGTRLVREIETWGKEQGANSIEIAVHKGNAEGRAFWIRRRFIDDDDRDMSTQPEYHCMVKPL